MELYKESSEEWSKKAGDLDGVIKAMEVSLFTIFWIFLLIQMELSLLLTEIFHLSEEKVENKLIEADVLLFNSPIF